MKNQKYTLQKFIQKKFKTTEKLPFETKQVFYPKNTVLISPGKIENKIYYISSGIIQSSLITNDGEENILVFWSTNQLMCALKSFITRKPTTFKIVCVTDCVLEVISHKNLMAQLKHSILANRFYRELLEFSYLNRIKKETSIMSKSTKERYLDFIHENPELIEELPEKTVASYLGIHPKSLSRLKKS